MLDDTKYNVANGESNNNLFNAARDVCEVGGSGFVDYIWEKPTKEGMTEPQPKISYVKEFKQWGWIVGTGVYVDDIEKIVSENEGLIIQKVDTIINKT